MQGDRDGIGPTRSTTLDQSLPEFTNVTTGDRNRGFYGLDCPGFQSSMQGPLVADDNKPQLIASAIRGMLHLDGVRANLPYSELSTQG